MICEPGNRGKFCLLFIWGNFSPVTVHATSNSKNKQLERKTVHMGNFSSIIDRNEQRGTSQVSYR